MPELFGKFRDTGLVEVKKEVLNREQAHRAFRRRRLLLDRTSDDCGNEVELGRPEVIVRVSRSKAARTSAGNPTPECSITPVNWGLSGAVDKWQRAVVVCQHGK
jgi:hypothetical protein